MVQGGREGKEGWGEEGRGGRRGRGEDPILSSSQPKGSQNLNWQNMYRGGVYSAHSCRTTKARRWRFITLRTAALCLQALCVRGCREEEEGGVAFHPIWTKPDTLGDFHNVEQKFHLIQVKCIDFLPKEAFLIKAYTFPLKHGIFIRPASLRCRCCITTLVYVCRASHRKEERHSQGHY